MLSYICEFNLNLAGEEAEKYLTSIVREWSALYAELSGVRGTLFLTNAFGLAGEYTYLYRVDMESIKTLQVIDDAIKSDDARWRNARAEWFGIRTGVRARLLRLDSVTPGYCSQSSGARDGLIHYVLTYGSGGHGREQVLANRELKDRLPEIWGTLKGVSTLQHFTAAVRSFNGGWHEVWARLADLSALEEVYQANDTHLGEILKAGSIITSLYGEMREVDGSLLIGA